MTIFAIMATLVIGIIILIYRAIAKKKWLMAIVIIPLAISIFQLLYLLLI
ncbi:hypothetical protein SAMN02746091_01056 [Caloramator proteoclasticus DSM 10124]|uniref:Uncharacterized protein n=1 Tax=Caloramator proteoclasticus DSM 10124 TaxID=1121262 RepID=A0A1M4W4F6_9CLOT|nr:hypothetical protein SAMN02746091_01056 [Caloramator proteoclasticus DSM 10124]